GELDADVQVAACGMCLSDLRFRNGIGRSWRRPGTRDQNVIVRHIQRDALHRTRPVRTDSCVTSPASSPRSPISGATIRQWLGMLYAAFEGQGLTYALPRHLLHWAATAAPVAREIQIGDVVQAQE